MSSKKKERLKVADCKTDDHDGSNADRLILPR